MKLKETNQTGMPKWAESARKAGVSEMAYKQIIEMMALWESEHKSRGGIVRTDDLRVKFDLIPESVKRSLGYSEEAWSDE